MERMKGKVAIVTGSAKGIGKAIAERLWQEGAHVVLADIDPDAATAAAAEFDPDGSRTGVVAADVAQPHAVHAMVDQVVAACGRIDILVSNAGIMDRMPFLEMTPEFWDRVTGINLRGAFLCGQAVARQMVAQGDGGRIVNVASNSGIFGGRGRSAYGASKAGLINLTQTMAIELAEHGINVNAVAPTFIRTPGTAPALADPAFKADVEERIAALHRIGEPVDVAGAVVYLASPASSLVTGTTLMVDGGWTAR